MVKIAVLGAGINGAACALRIKEKYKDFEVVLISDEFTPNTTGDGSGGLWYPYLSGNTSESLLMKWGNATFRYLHKLWLEGGLGINLAPVYVLLRTPRAQTEPEWADLVFGYHHLRDKQLEYFNRMYSGKYVGGLTFTTFVVPPSKMIPYLYQRFSEAGGKVRARKVSSLRDPTLEEFDVVINCTGLGARELVPDDKVFPIRGQIFKVKAPWVNQVILDLDSGHYIIPNDEFCVLGGTQQQNDFNTKPDEKDSEFILGGCRQILKTLANAEVIKSWVGLRPGRDEIRIESEYINGKLYIHNYGHGGSGLTLFWGCAADVLELLERRLNKNNESKSKL